jgi:hypothetical protein
MTFNVTRAELEQLTLRSVVAFGYPAVRRVRHEFVVPQYVPNARRFHRAVDADLRFGGEEWAGRPARSSGENLKPDPGLPRERTCFQIPLTACEA